MSNKRDNSGVLFKNEEKKSDSHPDYSGSATINGSEFFMDAWINTSDSGRKYMSFRFKAKQQKREEPQKPQRNAYAGRDDSPPF